MLPGVGSALRPKKKLLSAVARDPARTPRASISNPYPMLHRV